KEKQNKKEYYLKNKSRLRKKMQLFSKKWYQKNKKNIRLKQKEYYQKNKEKILTYHKKWYTENKKKVLQATKEYYHKKWMPIQQRHKNYYQKNKEKVLQYKGEWQKHRKKVDPKYHLDENMGTAIWASLKNKKAGQKWESLVGYTLEELIGCLEKQFDKKMVWENYGNYWVIDHVKPKTLFQYTSSNDMEFQQCWALKNLQPLEKIENIKKGNRYKK
ncbi:hypothetical protein L6252_02470, partial [Candidatus Parcubacteria bacterium]|nr:hypothetical protein [Candidatus Parcubacteria bacterium]